jgi:hypothetical protein
MRNSISEVVVKRNEEEQLLNDCIPRTDSMSLAIQTDLASQIDHLSMDNRANPLQADHIRSKNGTTNSRQMSVRSQMKILPTE